MLLPGFGLALRGQEVADIGPAAHVQVRGDPFQGHGGFGAQALRDADFARITFGAMGQFGFRPTEFLQFFRQQAAGLFRVGFPPDGPGRLSRGRHRRDAGEQFPTEWVTAKIPAAPEGLVKVVRRQQPLGIEVALELLAAGGIVRGDVEGGQQAIHAQPAGALFRRLEAGGPTAPTVGGERLPGAQQPGAGGIQMHVIAGEVEIAGGAAVHHDGFVTAAEQLARAAVAQIEARGVGAEQPFHAGPEVRARGFDDEMKMIGHEHVGVDVPAGFRAGFAQRGQKTPAIQVVAKNGFPATTPVHDVIDGARILDA